MSKQEIETKTEEVFDENGQTVESIPARVSETKQSEQDAKPTEGEKYRIGDKEFSTQKEALAYAQQLEADLQVSNAYQQGLRDSLSQQHPQQQNVTPEPEAYNTDELYTNPNQFLDKFANRIKGETRAEFEHKEQVREQSNQIWGEFTERHPALADFRFEVEDFVQKNQTDVRSLIAAKGKSAGYDFIATRLKSRFSAYASALSPRRELPNVGTTSAPNLNSQSVTPIEPQKNNLSMYEQIRKIRKRS